MKVGDKVKILKDYYSYNNIRDEHYLAFCAGSIATITHIENGFVSLNDNFDLQVNYNLFVRDGYFKSVEEHIMTQQKIDRLMFNFGEFLKEKNKRYGDSAISPMQLFSKLDASNSICIRIDDKLNRIKNNNKLKKNDVTDLIGYLLLYMIDQNWLTFEEMLD